MEDSTVNSIIALLGVPIGVLTYYFNKLWMEPYFEYEKLRARINSDLLYYADAVEIDMKNTECLLYKKYGERMSAFHRHAADLLALYPLLPAWHRINYFETREYPDKAVGQLLRYAKHPDPFEAREAEKEIKGLLRLPTILS
ncbi:hypothetical protein [Geomonas agri]|uniref:hypothetical protein n=1 Tax=Geomonas agri TaxID=2873702 RepID=UPI001CD27F04|nr:hypothetical protein [Geomonas agri]